jgi:translation initiation factor 3 subunit B
LEKAQGFAFTKNNSFKLYPLSEFQKYQDFDASAQQPAAVEAYKEQEDLTTWLTDENARDQYALKYYETVQIMWNDAHHKAVPVYSKENLSEDGIMWSPLGSYLVSFHKKGIALWGGEHWKVQGSYTHKNVRLCHFSPNERYMVTMNEDPTDNVIVWDVRSKRKETFTANDSIARLPEGRWPVFHWSYDGKYFARLGKKNELEVYESSTFKLLKGKPIVIDGIEAFAWSPSKNVIAYWTPEMGTIPAKVALMEVPKLNEARSKNFFKVIGVQLFWHKNGDFLAAAVDSEIVKKNTKSIQTNLEVFKMKEKSIPIEVIAVKETLCDFQWEPKGNRFAIIHGSQQLKKNVSFFSMEGGQNNSHKLLKELEPRQVDSLFWSPRGINLVIANTKSSTATLEFWDVNELDAIGYGEHFGMTNASWDPTGRYFCTYVSAHKRAADLGFIIWTFLGRPLHKINMEMLYEFHWRPRPPSLLSAAQDRKVKSQLKEKSKVIEKEVQAQADKVREGILKERQKQWDNFQEFLQRVAQEYEEMKQERYTLRGYGSDDEEALGYETKEEIVETVVDTTEEEVN